MELKEYQISIKNSQFVDQYLSNNHGLIGINNNQTKLVILSCQFINIDSVTPFAGIFAMCNNFQGRKICFDKVTAVYKSNGASAIHTKSISNKLEYLSVYACSKQESWHSVSLFSGDLENSNFSYADKQVNCDDTWSSAFCTYQADSVCNIIVFHCDGGNSISTANCEAIKNVDFIDCVPKVSIINSQAECLFISCVFVRSTKRITNFKSLFTSCYFDELYITENAEFIGSTFIVPDLCGKNQPLGKEICQIIISNHRKMPKLSRLLLAFLINYAFLY